MFYNCSAICRHIKRDHHMTSKEYLVRHGGLQTKLVGFRCEICKVFTKRNADSIRRHLRVIHGMSKEDYESRFQMKPYQAKSGHQAVLKRTNYQCQICKESLPGLERLNRHIKGSHRLTLQEYEGLYESKPGETNRVFTCQICKESMVYSEDIVSR